MKREIFEIREVYLTEEGLLYGPTVDARKMVTDAAVLCVRLNRQSQGTNVRYVYQAQRID